MSRIVCQSEIIKIFQKNNRYIIDIRLFEKKTLLIFSFGKEFELDEISPLLNLSVAKV